LLRKQQKMLGGYFILPHPVYQLEQSPSRNCEECNCDNLQISTVNWPAPITSLPSHRCDTPSGRFADYYPDPDPNPETLFSTGWCWANRTVMQLNRAWFCGQHSVSYIHSLSSWAVWRHLALYCVTVYVIGSQPASAPKSCAGWLIRSPQPLSNGARILVRMFIHWALRTVTLCWPYQPLLTLSRIRTNMAARLPYYRM